MCHLVLTKPKRAYGTKRHAPKVASMSDEQDRTHVKDLPGKPLTSEEEMKVRGGRDGNEDEDLDDLEIQR
jgi:hypothetical protein